MSQSELASDYRCKRDIPNINTQKDKRSLISLKHAAFTLSEVLITLGVIGVVAAITLPVLTKNYRNKALETAFKKQYSIVNQAVQKMYFDDPTIPISSKNFGDNVGKYFVNVKSCIQESITKTYYSSIPQKCGYYDIATWMKDTYKTYNKKSAGSSLHWYFDDGMYILTDGSFIFYDASTSTNKLISIDTNGIKKPNLLGHDLFVFEINANNGTLRPYSGGICSKTSNDGLNGLRCSINAMENSSDYFKNLP